MHLMRAMSVGSWKRDSTVVAEISVINELRRNMGISEKRACELERLVMDDPEMIRIRYNL